MAAATLLRGQTKRTVFGFNQYGMKRVPYREAISNIAKIGYKSVELAMPTWDTEPKLLSKTDRANIPKQIADLGLVLPSVMESLRIAGPNVNKPGNLERLRVAAEMAHELSPKTPAITTLGGSAGMFDELKCEMADELAVWAKTMEPLKTVLAIRATPRRLCAVRKTCSGCWTK